MVYSAVDSDRYHVGLSEEKARQHSHSDYVKEPPQLEPHYSGKSLKSCPVMLLLHRVSKKAHLPQSSHLPLDVSRRDFLFCGPSSAGGSGCSILDTVDFLHSLLNHPKGAFIRTHAY